MKKTAIALLLLGTGTVAHGCGIALNTVRSNAAPGALNTKGDSRIIAATCMAGFDSCESVARVEQPTDLEAWAFTYKEAQTAPYGIPAGEVPITLYIVGAKEQCDRAEARLASLKATGVGMKAISEPCHGPFYFKKDREAGNLTLPSASLSIGSTFDTVRERIESKWVYPREAGARGMEGRAAD
jgi:hypothetical protein